MSSGSRADLVLLVFAVACVAAALADHASMVLPPRDVYVSILVEAGSTGRSMPEIVARRGISERAWGRAAARFASDGTVVEEVRRLQEAQGQVQTKR
jgi:hypothetical protein